MVKSSVAVKFTLVSNLFLAISVSWGSCYQDLSLKRASVFLKSNLALELPFALCSVATLEEKWSYVTVSESSNSVVAACGTQECCTVDKL